MTIDGLSVYENGIPQQVFSFPWTVVIDGHSFYLAKNGVLLLFQ